MRKILRYARPDASLFVTLGDFRYAEKVIRYDRNSARRDATLGFLAVPPEWIKSS